MSGAEVIACAIELQGALLLFLRRRSWPPDYGAEDAAAETIAKVLSEEPDRFENARGLRAWLYRVARNIHCDRWRRRRREVNFSSFEEEESQNGEAAAQWVDDREIVALEEAVRKESAEEIRAAIKKLSVSRQDVVQLRYFDGLEYADIAECLGKSNVALRSLHLQALVQLRELLGIVKRKQAKPDSDPDSRSG